MQNYRPEYRLVFGSSTDRPIKSDGGTCYTLRVKTQNNHFFIVLLPYLLRWQPEKLYHYL